MFPGEKCEVCGRAAEKVVFIGRLGGEPTRHYFCEAHAAEAMAAGVAPAAAEDKADAPY